MNDAAWLESLKAGDEVVIRGGGSMNVEHIARVERVTATQVIVNRSRYRRTDGQRIGGDVWHSAWLAPVTDVVRDNLRRRALALWLDRQDFNRLSLEQLRAIQSVITGGSPPAQGG